MELIGWLAIATFIFLTWWAIKHFLWTIKLKTKKRNISNTFIIIVILLYALFDLFFNFAGGRIELGLIQIFFSLFGGVHFLFIGLKAIQKERTMGRFGEYTKGAAIVAGVIELFFALIIMLI